MKTAVVLTLLALSTVALSGCFGYGQGAHPGDTVYGTVRFFSLEDGRFLGQAAFMAVAGEDTAFGAGLGQALIGTAVDEVQSLEVMGNTTDLTWGPTLYVAAEDGPFSMQFAPSTDAVVAVLGHVPAVNETFHVGDLQYRAGQSLGGQTLVTVLLSEGQTVQNWAQGTMRTFHVEGLGYSYHDEGIAGVRFTVNQANARAYPVQQTGTYEMRANTGLNLTIVRANEVVEYPQLNGHATVRADFTVLEIESSAPIGEGGSVALRDSPQVLGDAGASMPSHDEGMAHDAGHEATAHTH